MFALQYYSSTAIQPSWLQCWAKGMLHESACCVSNMRGIRTPLSNSLLYYRLAGLVLWEKRWR
jgi:hypothetical protein